MQIIPSLNSLRTHKTSTFDSEENLLVQLLWETVWK